MTHQHPVSRPCPGPVLSRRATLGAASAALTMCFMPRAKAAVGFPQRLVIVNIHGGIDGLSLVVPYGDSNLAGLRAPLIPPAVGAAGGMFDLGGFFGLNPALVNIYSMYKAGQALAVHAVGPIVATRSHFLGQDVLQAGNASSLGSGWLNRLVQLLPGAAGGVEAGAVLGVQTPPIAQGPVQFGGWATGGFKAAPNVLAALIETVGVQDPLIGGPTQSGFNDQALYQSWQSAGGAANGLSPFVSAMRSAGLFLAASGGPAVAIIDTSSMDTHTDQVSRLAPLLSDLDNGFGALASAAGNSWANTVAMTITEFGRTAYGNGTGGTDHGTAFAMLLAGGAVKGGRVVTSWPGLATTNLIDKRDLQGTTDVRAVAMGVLRDHLGLSPTALATVFPGASGLTPVSGLVV